MALITIRSTEFNMVIDVECDREGMMDAFFPRTGNRLPKMMYARLERNMTDQREIANEYAAYRFYGDN